jgi:hypothetical protein
MKKSIVVDIDSDREPDVLLYDSNPFPQDSFKDLKLMCKAVCTLIHGMHAAGVQKDYQSLRDCIKHLEEGFVNPRHQAIVTPGGLLEKPLLPPYPPGVTMKDNTNQQIPPTEEQQDETLDEDTEPLPEPDN